LQVIALNEENLNVILHGDCWMNNMMFRYENNQPDAVKLIDFQISFYNSFANDLQYFIFSSAKADVITNSLDELLTKYFEKFIEVAPKLQDSVITLEKVRTGFFDRLVIGYIATVGIRSLLRMEVAPNLEDIFAGRIGDSGYASAKFVDDLKVLLPIFENANLI